MNQKRIEGGKNPKTYTSFQGLARDLMPLLGDIEDRRVKGSSDEVLNQMKTHLDNANDYVSNPKYQQMKGERFKQADDEAWKVLRLVRINKEDVLSGPDGVEKVEGDARLYVSAALTQIGLSYKFMRRHFDAVNFLERASELDPKNIMALRNLTDLCVSVKPNDLKFLGHYAKEINREVDVGIKSGEQLLDVIGLTKKQRNGQESIEEITNDSQKIINGTWTLNNLGLLYYRKGRYLSHNLKDDAGAQRNFKKSVECGISCLALMMDDRKVEQYYRRDPEDYQYLEAQSMTAARALSIIGLSSRMNGDPETAFMAFKASLKAKPELREAQDNLKRLLDENPDLESKVGEKLSKKQKKDKPKKDTLEVTSQEWEQKIGETKSVVMPVFKGDVELEKIQLFQVSQVRGELDNYRGLLDGSAAISSSFVKWAEQMQDEWWGGIDEENIVRFAAVKATVEHVAENKDKYGDSAGYAKKVVKGYDMISDTMITEDLEKDGKNLVNYFKKKLVE